MKKHLYEIKRLEIPAYLKWWFIKKKFAGTLSEVMENLTSPITLTDSLKRKFKIFEISGNSVQDGTPIPDNPLPIQNVNGNVDVKVENKNLYDENSSYNVNASSDPNNYNYPAGNGGNRYTYFCKVKSNTTYTFSCKEIGDRLCIFGINNIINPLDYSTSNRLTFNTLFFVNPQSGNKTVTFTTEENTKMIAVYYSFETIPSEIMIEENSTATNYEPHEEQTVTFPLATGQVLHLSDTLEDDGVHQRRFTRVLDGTENWDVSGLGNNIFWIPTQDAINPSSSDTKIYAISNYYKGSYRNNLVNENYAISINNRGTSNYGQIAIKNKDIANITELREYLSQKYANGTPVTVEYELAEPIIVPYTREQQEAYDEIKKIYSYKGTTHISSDNEPSPIFKIQYVKNENSNNVLSVNINEEALLQGEEEVNESTNND